MNANRRKRIAEVVNRLDLIKDLLTEIADDEEMAYDNIPDSLKESARAEESQDSIDSLSEAIDGIEEVLECLKDI